MKITSIEGREIFDSRGLPTIECQLEIDEGFSVIASVPSGASKGLHEAIELRDGGERLLGKGVSKAITNLETIIAPALLGKVPDIFEMDDIMIHLDGTPNKENIGANAILAASIAIVKAQALCEGMELYELIAQLFGADSISMPFPLFNMINGGAHANNQLRIQECMIIPVTGQNFREAMEFAVLVFSELKKLLIKNGKSTAVGDEGGFAPVFENDLEALDYLTQAMQKFSGADTFRIALDVAASQFYDPKTKQYDWNGTLYSSHDLIEFYERLIQQYPICSIEDGLAEDDWDGWVEMTKILGEKVQLVGDDLFATNLLRIKKGIELDTATAVLIKPNQIGTVSETLQAIALCKQYGFGTVISHRSGETCDTFIADLAVGTSAGQIKAGGCSRGERMAKYNRLLRIEDALLMSLLDLELE